MSKPKLTESDKAWLAQFTPVDEATLTESAADFMARIRAMFRKAKVGMKPDGRLQFYLIDKVAGPFSGSFPPWCCPEPQRAAPAPESDSP